MENNMVVLKNTYLMIGMGLSSACAFIGTYLMDVTMGNAEQYMAVMLVLLLDGFFGIISGMKREGFKTYKALKVLKNMFAWVVILTVILSIELGFKGTSWLSETIIAPFMVFQMVSALKNASMAGFIKNELLNEILDRIDSHKGKRNK
jgi:hypothetical protein